MALSPRPSRSITCGRNFCTSTSARAISRRRISMPSRLLEVDRDRPLAAIGRDEQGGELAGRVDRLAAAPRDVAAERLDLDHVGALVGQEHRGEGAGHHAGEVDHLNTGQGTCHACSRVSFRHLYEAGRPIATAFAGHSIVEIMPRRPNLIPGNVPGELRMLRCACHALEQP